jgi:hypothetical protein
MDFDRTQALLRQTVRSDGLAMADTIKFDVVDPADTANTRGRDGKIPVSQLGLSQVSTTSKEYFKKFSIDNFDLFRANPNTRNAMIRRGVGAINKSIDQVIIDELDTTSVQVSGSAAALNSLAQVSSWITILLGKDVPRDGNLWAVITPNAEFQLLKIAEYKSADFILWENKPVAQDVVPGFRTWLGVKWIVHTGLTGRGTSSAKMYMYHTSALGHMIDGEPESHPYYYEPEDRYECWVRARHAAKVVLPRGVCQYLHDDTASF